MSLERLINPQSIAVIGGGAWCEAVLRQCLDGGFEGPIYSVHPKRAEIMGIEAYTSIDELPSPPDASFIGVNRFATVEVVRALSKSGAGGAVCFASGFQESEDGEALNEQLLEAAGDFTLLGPNCYGFLNYLDGAMLWPDVHGGKAVESGVAIIAQSSNIALNLTMQNRGLPISHLITVGNQAQTSMADVGKALLADERVTALGLYVEGFGDIRALEALAAQAQKLGKPIITVKAGQSEEARAATVSHTASLAGSDAGANALMKRLGIARVNSLPVLLESLKLAHVFGALSGNAIATLSCSGGEASLIADTASRFGVKFPTLTNDQIDTLSAHLNELVTLTNPLDYHTFIWRNREAMAAVFMAMASEQVDLTIIILDFPKGGQPHHPDWLITLDAIEDAAQMTARRFGVLASLPETMPEDIADRLHKCGIVAFSGFDEAMQAINACQEKSNSASPLLLSTPLTSPTHTLNEAEAKGELQSFGLTIPSARYCKDSDAVLDVTQTLTFPVVVKALGLAHKTEAGGVVLNIQSAQAAKDAANAMPASEFIVEEMITGAIAELLVGVVRDDAHGFVLTIAAGGIYTEIMKDQHSMLIPTSKADILTAINRLNIAPLLNGYRGQASANLDAIANAVLALQDYVIANADKLSEVEINPLIVRGDRAIAADALITKSPA
ncbi:MAG: acetate--CoA ligase family protein [Hyphomicrobiales bacterium]